MEKLPWLVKQVQHKDFEVIHAIPWHDYHHHENDPGCYVLIRLYPDTHDIGVAICNYTHEILKEFRGKRAQDLYSTIFEYEQKHGLSWFTRKDHIAYLGKELKKAELALASGTSYHQE